MLAKIDRWIEDRHQDVVDWSQKKPAWWGGQLSMFIAGYLVFGLMIPNWGSLNEYPGYLGLALLWGATIAAWLSSLSDWLFASDRVRDIVIRKAAIVVFVVIAILETWACTLGAEFTIRNLHWYIVTGAFTSYMYFSTCKPPAPPKRKPAPVKVAHAL